MRMAHNTIQTNFSRRSLIKSGLIGGAAIASGTIAPLLKAQNTRGIKGVPAPELSVPYWIDANGKEQQPFSVLVQKGKWVYLKCFQDWCPACHSIGFPNLQKLRAAFPDDSKVVSAVIQTTFEGFSTNTADALRKNQLRYELDLPFGHDAGNSDLPHNDIGRVPKTMAAYRTGGTPWVVVIDPNGRVAFNDFHINIEKFIEFMQEVTA